MASLDCLVEVLGVEADSQLAILCCWPRRWAESPCGWLQAIPYCPAHFWLHPSAGLDSACSHEWQKWRWGPWQYGRGGGSHPPCQTCQENLAVGSSMAIILCGCALMAQWSVIRCKSLQLRRPIMAGPLGVGGLEVGVHPVAVTELAWQARFAKASDVQAIVRCQPGVVVGSGCRFWCFVGIQ